MAYDYLEANHIDVFNSFTGGGLVFPKAFTEPGGGVLSAYKGHFGQGSSTIPYSASLVSGPSGGPIPTPLSWNFLGLGVETGTRNMIGVDVKIGSNIALGAISANYNALFKNVVGKGAEVAALKARRLKLQEDHNAAQAKVAKAEAELTAKTEELQMIGLGEKDTIKVFKGKGCLACSPKGFQVAKPGYYYVNEIKNEYGQFLYFKGGISYDWKGGQYKGTDIRIGPYRDSDPNGDGYPDQTIHFDDFIVVSDKKTLDKYLN